MRSTNLVNDGSENGSTDEKAQPYVPRFGRVLKLGTRTAWDSLGLVCGVSLLLFCVFAGIAALAVKGCAASQPLYIRSASTVLALAAWPLVCSPLLAGICSLAYRMHELSRPVAADYWPAIKTLYKRSAIVGAYQIGIASVLTLNIVFYQSRGALIYSLLAIMLLYGLFFFGTCAVYQLPLVVAGAAGDIKRDDGREPTAASAMRNSLVLAMAAPGFTIGILLVIIASTAVLTFTGVGMALLGPGYVAFLATQATREQLARFGMVPPPPDLNAPTSDDHWRLQS